MVRREGVKSGRKRSDLYRTRHKLFDTSNKAPEANKPTETKYTKKESVYIYK